MAHQAEQSKEFRAFEDAIYIAARELENMAIEACQRQDTNAVHYYVSESRKLHIMVRNIARRNGY